MALPERIANSPVPGTVTALTTLAAELSSSAASISVLAAAPTALQGEGQARLVIGSEVILVNTATLSTTSWEVLTRGAEGSTAAAHIAGTSVYNLLTKAALEELFPARNHEGRVGESVLPVSVVSGSEAGATATQPNKEGETITKRWTFTSFPYIKNGESGVVAKGPGSTVNGVINASGEGASGYIIHLAFLGGTETALVGLGTDLGTGAGLLVSVKNTGPGVISNQNPGAGPGIQVVGLSQAAAPLLIEQTAKSSPVVIKSKSSQGIPDGATIGTTLTTALVATANVKELAVAEITTPYSLPSGSTVTLKSGANTQTFTLSAPVATGATTIAVNEVAANFSYPVGSTWMSNCFMSATATFVSGDTGATVIQLTNVGAQASAFSGSETVTYVNGNVVTVSPVPIAAATGLLCTISGRLPAAGQIMVNFVPVTVGQYVLNVQAEGAADPTFVVNTEGKLLHGAGGSNALDASFSRISAGIYAVTSPGGKVAHPGLQIGEVRWFSGSGAPGTITGARVGDRYARNDTPTTAKQREYICTTAETGWEGIV